MKSYLTSMPVPAFGIGETEAPFQYLRDALPEFGNRVGMSGRELKRFIEAGLASAEACIPLMSEGVLIQGMVQPIPEARTFWNLVGDTLLSPRSSITGFQNLKMALNYQQEGYNIAVVQNHRSGADMLVMETLIRRYIGKDICAEWSYMAGHAVNLFLIPLMFGAGLRRFQIFSVKYQSVGIPGMNISKMREQNQRAIRSLREYTSEGGKVLVYYPEGGRGDGCMKKGEPRTSCLLKNIAQSDKPLIILPTYVNKTEELLRPVRSENEFNEVFKHMSAGTAYLSIGSPVAWNDLCMTNMAYESDKFEWNRRICDTLLGLVARLGPVQEAGCYSHEDSRVRELIEPFINGGA